MKKRIILFALVCLSMTGFSQWSPTEFPVCTPWLACTTSNGNLLVGSYAPPIQVFMSDDMGNSFTEIASLAGVAYTSYCQVEDTVLLGGFGGSIARSHDHGQTWDVFDFSQAFAPGTEISDCYGLEYLNGRLYAAGFGAGIAYSEDMGETWESTDQTSLIAACDGNYTYALKAYQGVLYAFAVDGFLRYDESNDRWVYITSSLYPANAIVHKGELYVGHSAPNGPFFIRKTSDGTNWQNVDAPFAVITNEARSLASHNDILYVGSAVNGIFYSLDDGNTWVDFSDGFPNGFGDTYITPLNFAFIGDTVFLTGYDFLNGGLFQRATPHQDAVEEHASDTSCPFGVVFQNNISALILYGHYLTAQIEIFDVLGNPVIRYAVGQHEGPVCLSNLSAGIYVYRVVSEQGCSVTGRFVR